MENTSNPVIDIEMQDGGHIRAELYPSVAPKTVENFIKLVHQNFYDGLIFHRIIKGFMIQGGCPDGNGTGGPGWHIEGEFAHNGFPNSLKHTRGVLSMARSQDPNSAGSQFFIMTDNSPHLDGAYAAFGKVLDENSLRVVDQIVNSKTPRTELESGKNISEIKDENGNPIAVHQGNADCPITPQRIKRITIEAMSKMS